MRWKNLRRSTNVEDSRGARGPGRAIGGGVGVLILALVGLFFGPEVSSLLSQFLPTQGAEVDAREERTAPLDDEASQFIRAVLGSTEDVWNRLFEETGRPYVEPRLELFTDAVQSGCGFQSAQVGPFYCPADSMVYLDLSFFEALAQRHNATGDFAQAYVIAHEVGHHVQNLLGISDQVHAERRGQSAAESNELSVRLELQADFLAGVWAHHAQNMAQILEAGDVEEAMNAAAQIGDDTLQRQAQGYVSPESFTHGTSEQRVRWFKLGLETGDLNRGDTFQARDL